MERQRFILFFLPVTSGVWFGNVDDALDLFCFTFNTADFIKVNQGGLVTFEIFVMKGSDLFFTTRRVEITTRRVGKSNPGLFLPHLAVVPLGNEGKRKGGTRS